MLKGAIQSYHVNQILTQVLADPRRFKPYYEVIAQESKYHSSIHKTVAQITFDSNKKGTALLDVYMITLNSENQVLFKTLTKKGWELPGDCKY